MTGGHDESGERADEQKSGPVGHEQDRGPEEPRRLAVRRAPRYRVFVGTGVLVAVVAALVLALLAPPDARFSRFSVFGYLALLLGLVGALLGGVVAVLFERRR